MSLTNAGIPSSQKDQACTVQARRSTIKDQIPIHRLSYAEYLHDKTEARPWAPDVRAYGTIILIAPAQSTN
jgi:hypothetical protein